MRISVITNDKYLFRLAEIKLNGKAAVISGFDPNADVVIYDCDSKSDMPKTEARVIKVSRSEGEDSIRLPLDHTFFESVLLSQPHGPKLSLAASGKHALINSKEIKLTAHEYALLSLLISGGENYTSREQIANGVWNGATDSLVNVYIHYLREKLETDGEKIIISSRKYGYKINPIYINYGNSASYAAREKGELS